MSNLQEEMRVNILYAGQKIDEGIVRRMGTGGSPPTEEIEIESLQFHPGDKKEFAFIRHSDPAREGWRMLFEDPMTRGRCFSKRSSTYTFEPVP